MIAKTRMVVLGVVLACAAGACKRSSTAPPDASSGTASADPVVADAGIGIGIGRSTEIDDALTAGDAAVNVPAAPEERKTALAALVSGSGNASALPVSATDPGAGFDRSLRKRLTTVQVPAAPEKNESVLLGGATLTVPVVDADRVIAGLRPRFRACYRTGLTEKPSMAGKLVLAASLSPEGEVKSASVVSNAGISSTVADCVSRVLQRAQFDAPGGTGSTLTLPVTFSQSPEL